MMKPSPSSKTRWFTPQQNSASSLDATFKFWIISRCHVCSNPFSHSPLLMLLAQIAFWQGPCIHSYWNQWDTNRWNQPCRRQARQRSHRDPWSLHWKVLGIRIALQSMRETLSPKSLFSQPVLSQFCNCGDAANLGETDQRTHDFLQWWLLFLLPSYHGQKEVLEQGPQSVTPSSRIQRARLSFSVIVWF